MLQLLPSGPALCLRSLGDNYSAGDVLLDIETDKAQMDVEAQEDGVLAKIMSLDGSKGIKVGARIAVMAEQGDDLSSLEIPAEESRSPPASDQSGSNGPKEAQSIVEPPREAQSTETSSTLASGSKHGPQKYPLYPAVQALLRENGLGPEEAEKIQASGPGGRLLKGDVLSHLGRIKRDYSAQQSSRITKMGHLDLSNIQRAEPKPQPKTTPPPTEAPKAQPEPDLQVAVSISLDAVLATQKRVKDTLGLTLPLSTFIARASAIANEGLPRAKHPPTADELYDAVLGLDKVKKTSHGLYSPQVTALAKDPLQADSRPTGRNLKTEDVIDILTGSSKTKPRSRSTGIPSANGVASANSTSVFSVSAKKGEEKRTRTYLERVKSVLEAEPGRCVL